MGIITLSPDEATERISSCSSKITVVGLGKMGLPIAMCFTNAGFNVVGLDISQTLVDSLNRGETTIDEPEVPERLKSAVEAGKFSATTDPQQAVADSDFVIVIIPVLVDEKGDAELKALLTVYENLCKYTDGVVFIQESTLPPGTTDSIIRSILEKNGVTDGQDFGLVFAPERTFSGRAIKDIEENYPKIIGGTTQRATDLAALLYEKIAKKGVIKVSDATTAEAIKTFKGAYRDVNIALANQFAVLADKLGIDILEVIEVANTEPYSHIHRPGIGVGGHCIPVYPRFVINLGRKQGYLPTLLSEGREANDFMVDYAIDMIDKVTPDWERNVLVLGLAYRNGVKEHRLSPTLRLVEKLRLRGVERLKVLDPLYSKREVDAILGKDTGFETEESWDKTIDQALMWSSIIVIVTDHDQFKKMSYLLLSNKIVYDGRYVLNETLARDFYLLQPGRMARSTLTK